MVATAIRSRLESLSGIRAWHRNRRRRRCGRRRCGSRRRANGRRRRSSIGRTRQPRDRCQRLGRRRRRRVHWRRRRLFGDYRGSGGCAPPFERAYPGAQIADCRLHGFHPHPEAKRNGRRCEDEKDHQCLHAPRYAAEASRASELADGSRSTFPVPSVGIDSMK